MVCPAAAGPLVEDIQRDDVCRCWADAGALPRGMVMVAKRASETNRETKTMGFKTEELMQIDF
jgi:hypothetical protein